MTVPERGLPSGQDGAVIDAEAIEVLRDLSSEDDDVLLEVLEFFRDDVGVRLAMIESAINCGDSESLWQAAHALRSGAANLGAIRVVALCDAIQDLGRSGSVQSAGPLSRHLQAACEEALAALAVIHQRDH